MADTRPGHVPVWATTTNYATNPDPAMVGQPTKASPSSIEAEGFKHITRPNPRHLNYWMNEVGQWCSWVNSKALSADGGTKVVTDPLVLQGQGITYDALASCIITSTGGFFCSGTAWVTSGCDFTFLSGARAKVNSGAAVQFDSGSSITGVVAFSGTSWLFTAPVTVDTTTLTFAGTGHARYRSFALNTSGAQSIGIANGDRFHVPLLVGTLTITLDTPPAGSGSPELCISAHENIASGFSAQVTTAEGTYLLRADSGASYYSSLDVIYRDGAWHTLRAVMVP